MNDQTEPLFNLDLTEIK